MSKHYHGLKKKKPHGMKRNPVSKAKAGEILRHGEVRGHTLTAKQKGLFGAIRGGQKIRKV